MTLIGSELRPGQRLRHSDGHIVTLDRRKTPDDDHRGLPYLPGWWLRNGAGGLADLAIEDWTLLDERPTENPEGDAK